MNVWFPLPPIERYAPATGGAIATCVMQVVRGLVHRGHAVTVFADNHGDAPYDAGRFIDLGLDARRRGLAGLCRRVYGKLRWRTAGQDWPGYDVYVGGLVERMRGLERPDAIVCCNDIQLPAYLSGAYPAAKQVCWIHNELWTRHPEPGALLGAIDGWVANSGYISDWLVQAYKLTDAPRVVHNGVDLEAYRPRADWEVARQPVKVLCLGRIDPNKGADLAAKAVLTLKDKGVSAELTVVGGEWFFEDGRGEPSEYARRLRSLVERSGGSYLGHKARGEVPAIVRDHDVLCVLSRSQEPFGLVVLEGMASGCAVITSGRGGLPEAGGEAGLIVDIDDEAQVAETLASLIEDPEALVQLKRRSLAHAASCHWDGAAEAFEAVLSGLTGADETPTATGAALAH